MKGNLVAATDRRGHTATFPYEAADRLSKLVRRDGTEVPFAYDGDGRLRSATEGRANTWRFTYDQAGRQGTATNPRGPNPKPPGSPSASPDRRQTSAEGCRNAPLSTALQAWSRPPSGHRHRQGFPRQAERG